MLHGVQQRFLKRCVHHRRQHVRSPNASPNTSTNTNANTNAITNTNHNCKYLKIAKPYTSKVIAIESRLNMVHLLHLITSQLKTRSPLAYCICSVLVLLQGCCAQHVACSQQHKSTLQRRQCLEYGLQTNKHTHTHTHTRTARARTARTARTCTHMHARARTHVRLNCVPYTTG